MTQHDEVNHPITVNAGWVQEVVDRTWFISRLKIDVITDCWEWIGSRTMRRGGYGQMSRKSKVLRAHRVSWMLHNGDIPPGMFVCHACDNPPCCNPAHLFLGSSKENSDDCFSKGRGKVPSGYVGDKCPASKLTSIDIPEIRARLSRREPMHRIASHYGVTTQAIHRIKKGETWKTI